LAGRLEKSSRPFLFKWLHPDNEWQGRVASKCAEKGRVSTAIREWTLLLYAPIMRFLLRVVLNTVAVLLAARIIPGIFVASPTAAVLAGIVLGVINATIKPVLIVLTLPFTLLTLGLFIFLVNAVCLALVAWLVPGFGVHGFWAAVFGSVFISLVSWALSALVTDRRRY
jgi:putative membrane protein